MNRGCDRILVPRRGRLVADLNTGATEATITATTSAKAAAAASRSAKAQK